MKNNLKSNVLFFSPFLFIYITFFIEFNVSEFRGDEERYYQLAKNLLNGYYSSYAGDLPNGPGYPIFIMPFIALDLSPFYIRFTNVLLHYFSILLLFSSIKKLNIKLAYFISFFWGCYYIAIQDLPLMISETLTIFLISLFIYSINCLNGKKYIILSGITLGYLALTKVIFTYVIIMLLIYTLTYYLLSKSSYYKNGVIISIIALFVISPYIIYTYNTTGKLFYLTNQGGSVLYWMSSPNENEYGDWNNETFTANCLNKSKNNCNAEYFRNSHETFFKRISNIDPIERDTKLKDAAINNILNNPIKYANNWISNISRMLLATPNSYYFQNNNVIYRFIPNSIIFTILVCSIYISIINWKNIPFNIKFTALLPLFYLSLSSILSASPRHFYIIVPVILFYFSFLFNKTISIKPLLNK